MKATEKRLNANVDEGLHASFRRSCKDEERTMSAVLRELVAGYIEEDEQEEQNHAKA